jgi:hypothetical protein
MKRIGRMKRISRLVLVLPLILAAAPAHPGPMPVPPIPPAHPPTDGPAPTPDQDAAAPSVPEFDGPRITPRILQAPSFHNSFDPSQGYVNGSRWKDDPLADRRLPSPGFNLLIPFK